MIGVRLSKKERLKKICEILDEEDSVTSAEEAVALLAKVFNKVEDEYAPPLQDRMRVVPLSVMYPTEIGYIKLYMKHMLRVTDDGRIYFQIFPKGIKTERLLQHLPTIIQSMEIVFMKE